MRVLTFKLTTLVVLFFTSVGFLLAQSVLPQASFYLNENAAKFGTNPDVQWRVSDEIKDEAGVSHVYILQTYKDIDVYNQQVSIHIKDDAVFHSTGRFAGKIKKSAPAFESITATQAVQIALQDRGLNTSNSIAPISVSRTANKEAIFQLNDIAKQPVKSSLLYVPNSADETDINLVWDVDIYEKSGQNWWTIHVNAVTGEVLNVRDQIIHCDFGAPDLNEYNDRVEALQAMTCEEEAEALANGFMDFSIYGRTKTCNNHAHHHAATTNASKANTGMLANTYFAMPLGIESPNHGAGGVGSFVTLTDPANDDPTDTPSPFGWHDTDGVAGAEFTNTRGNNVFAYEDRTGAGFSPDGGAALDFNFVPDFAANPTTNPTQSAAIVNLFVWNNFMHDVFYNYGFTEECGNFQENNYGNGGTGGDSVNAEAQDGGGTNNANFGTPTDGGNPTMQMYLWDAPNPDIDGDFDNGIIAHEYGHGISIRLTGGPSNVGCLNGGEQMGEGWSDWWGLVLSVRPTDNANTPRGIGTYALDQPTSGAGIRPFPYSRDLGVNPQTYASVAGAVAPHGVGSIWCTMIWDLYWDLVDAYGYDNDLYNGTGGNNIAMNLITQGCKYQACSPGFVDGRDGILAADQALYGGANACIIWSAFARRGVGVNALQGSGSSQSDQTENFELPLPYTFAKTADKTTVGCNEVVTFTLTTTLTGGASACSSGTPTNVNIEDILPAGLMYVPGSASDGGTESGGTITWPVIPSLSGNVTYTYQTTVDCSTLGIGVGMGPVTVIEDDVESGQDPLLSISNENGTGDNWVISTAQANSGSSSWFAVESFLTGSFEKQYLTIAPFTVPASGTTELKFNHRYDTETRWDGGYLEVSTDGGGTWALLNAEITQNGYTSTIDNNAGEPAWAGNSGGWIETKVDLSTFVGTNVSVRFVFHYDYSVTGDGWYIDDINLTTGATFLKNIANFTENGNSLSDIECLSIQNIYLAPKVFLQGGLSGTLMDLALNTSGIIPATEPYTALGFTHINGGGEMLAASIGGVTGNDKAVDWVFVELRDAATGTTVIATRSALLQADGDVVDVDGTSAVAFSAPAGTYHVAIRHRNHLGVMTATAVSVN